MARIPALTQRELERLTTVFDANDVGSQPFYLGGFGGSVYRTAEKYNNPKIIPTNQQGQLILKLVERGVDPNRNWYEFNKYETYAGNRYANYIFKSAAPLVARSARIAVFNPAERSGVTFYISRGLGSQTVTNSEQGGIVDAIIPRDGRGNVIEVLRARSDPRVNYRLESVDDEGVRKFAWYQRMSEDQRNTLTATGQTPIAVAPAVVTPQLIPDTVLRDRRNAQRADIRRREDAATRIQSAIRGARDRNTVAVQRAIEKNRREEEQARRDRELFNNADLDLFNFDIEPTEQELDLAFNEFVLEFGGQQRPENVVMYNPFLDDLAADRPNFLGVDDALGDTYDEPAVVPYGLVVVPEMYNTAYGNLTLGLDTSPNVGPNGDAIPVHIVSVSLVRPPGLDDDLDTMETVVQFLKNRAYTFVLSQTGANQDANDYAQIRLMQPPNQGMMWDITSELLPATDVVEDFMQQLQSIEQSESRLDMIMASLQGLYEFKMTFVLAGLNPVRRRRNNPAVNARNIVDVLRLSRAQASTLNQRNIRPERAQNAWVRANPAPVRTRPVAPTTVPSRRTYTPRRNTAVLDQIRAAAAVVNPANAVGIDLSQWGVDANGNPVRTGRKRTYTDEQKAAMNQRRRENRKKNKNGLYSDLKSKITHSHSQEMFYQQSNAVQAVPNTFEEGYCMAMSFMISQCRIYNVEDGSVYETIPSATQPETGRYAFCPIIHPFEHLEDQDCHFITADKIILFNPYKFPSNEPEAFIKYALSPPANILQLWYQAAQNMHTFVMQEVGMDLDPNNMSTLQAYADVFGVHIAIYYKESRLKRSTIISPVGANVDLRKEKEIKVVSLLMNRTHSTSITNLRTFLRSSASANRSSIHNYCVFCDHIWTSNNQNAAEAKTHFFECMEKKKGVLMKDTLTKDRTGVLRDIHTRQFFYDGKIKLMRCHTCNAPMENGVHQGQLDHECYMKTNMKIKMGEEKDYYVFDFETKQERRDTTTTMVHTVNLVCVQSMYPLENGEYDKHVFHTLAEFVKYIMEHSTVKRVYLAHNGSKFDTPFIARYLEDNMIPFESIPTPSSMHAFLSLTIRFGNDASATFLDFRHFMPGSLKNIANAFGLDSVNLSKGDFPHLFNDGTHDAYVGAIPELHHPKDYWCLNSKRSQEDVDEFKEWYQSQTLIFCTCVGSCTCTKRKWDFQEIITEYCLMDVAVLAECAKRYRDWMVNLGQGEDEVSDENEWVPTGVDPFQYLTAPQVCQIIQLAGLPEEYRAVTTRWRVRAERIKLAIPWMERMQGMYTNGKIHHVGNSTKEFWEPKTKRYIDGISDGEEMHVFVCLNCQFHGCARCYYEEIMTGVDHPVRPSTYAGVQNDTEWFVTNLLRNYGSERVHITWEHEVKEMNFNDYERELGNMAIHREMFYGGRAEVFKVFANAAMLPGYEIKHMDVRSLYPDRCRSIETFVGVPQHLCNRDIDRRRVLDSESYDRYMGYVRCTVVPNEKCLLGLLPLHDPESKRLTFPLNKMTGTWGTEELRLAWNNGYEILDIYEVYHWPPEERSNAFFWGFVNYFYRIKMEAEGWKKLGGTSETPSEEDKTRLVQEMGVENNGLSLVRPDRVRKNETLRAMAKLMLNSNWGKYGQNAHTDHFTTIYGYRDFSALWNDPHVDRSKMCFRYLSDGVFKVKYHMYDDFAEPNSRTNIHIAAQVTESARVVLMSKMIQWGPSQICACDTDSIMGIVKIGEPDMTGRGLGHWVDEHPHARITRFMALAPKFYHMELEGEEDHLRCKGIMMNWVNRARINGYTLGKQILELFYPKSDEDGAPIPFSGFIPMQNRQIRANSANPHFRYGEMLTIETRDKRLAPVIGTKRVMVPYLHTANKEYDDRTELDRIRIIHTIPIGYKESVETMSAFLYDYLN